MKAETGRSALWRKGAGEALTGQQRLWLGLGNLLYAIKPLILYLFLPVLLSSVGMLLGRRDAGEVVAQSGNFYYGAGIVLTVYLLHRASRKRGSSLCQETTLEYRSLDWRRAVLLAAMGMGLALTFSALLTLLPLPGILTASYARTSDGFRQGTDRLLAFVSVIALAPVAEEIVFRGYLLGRLLEWFDARQGIFISAALFALCHVSFLWILYAGFMGVLLAWVSIREDNLSYSIALHIGFNASVLLVEMVNAVRQGRTEAFSFCLVLFCGAAALCLAIWAFRRYTKEEYV